MAGDFQIGSNVWPGLAKIQEEAGELITVLGKLQAFPGGRHPTQGKLITNLHEEIGDVSAAIEYFVRSNPCEISIDRINQRAQNKLNQLIYWHKQARR